jgi:hypothetical protein
VAIVSTWREVDDRRPGESVGAHVGRAVGYAVAAGFGLAFLYLLNVAPGWDAVPFLTSSTAEVLPWVNASLWVGVVLNVIYAVRWSWWVRPVGEIVSSVVAVAAAQRVWAVFPFDVEAPWSWLVRWVLVVVIVGSVISVVVQLVRLVRGPGGT